MLQRAILLASIFSTFAAAEPSQPQFTDAFKTRAMAAGYSVRTGKMTIFGIEQCPQAIEVFGNCLGNNPAAPYLVPLVPQVPGEFVDPYYKTSRFLPEEDPTLSGTYRLQPNEAIVLIGQSPPKGAYFGVQSYLFARKGTAQAPFWLSAADAETADLLYRQSPNPSRLLLFASVSEAMNQVTLSQQLGVASGFNQRFYFISSPDKSTAESVKRMLVESGASSSAIHTEAIPSTARLGLGADADDLMILIRYSLPESLETGEAWRNAPPVQVLRVSGPSSTLTAVSRFGEQSAPERTGHDEGMLSTALGQLESSIKTTLGLLSVTTKTLAPVSLLGLTGIKCIQNGMNCLGDTLDTDTYRKAGGLFLDEKDAAIAFGVNHTQTQNATYVSIAVLWEQYLMGVNSTSQTAPAAGFVQGELNGSVEKFQAAYPQMPMPLILSAAKSKLYVHLFARNCSGLPLCTAISESEIPYGESIALMQRAYLKPGSTTGPEVSKLLSPKVIYWKR